MEKANRRVVHSVTVACLLLAGVILYYIVVNTTGLGFSQFGEQRTRLEFVSEHSTKGFSKQKMIYTENGITSVNFTGKITVDGTAEIIVSAEDGTIIYRETYENMKSKSIQLDITDLSPFSYYTICFSSIDALSGKLILSTDVPLVVHPEKPER